MDYDIIVIGAGPAGSVFAYLCPEDKKTLLVNGSKQRYLGKGKPCGGLVSTDAQSFLEKHNMKIPEDIYVTPQRNEIRTVDTVTGADVKYPRNYINVSREGFDNWLYLLASERCDTVFALCKDISENNGFFRVSIEKPDGSKAEYSSKYIVGADGASSYVRHHLFPKFRPNTYTAIQQSFLRDDGEPFFSCVFDGNATDLCAWSFYKNEYMYLGGAFPRDKSMERFEKLKADFQEKFKMKLGKPENTSACEVVRPKSKKDCFTGEGNVFLIGEAAGFISASSLEGFSFAMKSAEKLAESMREKNPCKAYKKKIRSLRFVLYTKILKARVICSQRWRSLIFKSGIGSVRTK